jgi:flagellar hook assembly protein FlgD
LAGEATAAQVCEFSPELRHGLHEIIVKVYRYAGGGIDSLHRRLTVQVSDEYRLLSVFNYPNPFRENTEFTFVLAGAQPPDEAVVRIFTVSGRRIREIRLLPGQVGIGFNRVPWDGRDAEGDEVANGYYFYQVQISGEGRTVSAIQKLVRMR